VKLHEAANTWGEHTEEEMPIEVYVVESIEEEG
jgi:hypothetical protein